MRSSTQKALLARNFPTDLIAKVESHDHTVTLLDAMSKTELRKHYSNEEADFIAEKIKRQPIPDDVLERVIDAADGTCCYCADGNSARPFQIHHIHEYASSQDNAEDNLLLLCPNHHVSIPKVKTQDQQKQVRREWYAVVAVAKVYRKAGIPFPYGRFVAVDYDSPADPAAVIDDYRLTPSTAQIVTTGETADAAESRLTTTGFLVVAGGSGSGKTTLAYGVAGRLARGGRLVFSYRPPKLGVDRPLADVLTFIHTADKSGVLILDDANLDFRESELADVRAAAGGKMSVIATWTKESAGDNSRFERHHPDWLLVCWEVLRPGVRTFLLANEAAVVGSRKVPDAVRRSAGWSWRSRHATRGRDAAIRRDDFLHLRILVPTPRRSGRGEEAFGGARGGGALGRAGALRLCRTDRGIRTRGDSTGSSNGLRNATGWHAPTRLHTRVGR